MLTLHPVSRVRGEIMVPGDKSISHRAIMFGSLAKGDTHVTGFLESADCLSTMDCFNRLGIYIEKDWEHPGTLTVHGTGIHGLYPSYSPVALYSGNSGTTTRIMTGILAPQRFITYLSGDDSVNSRPMKRVMDPINAMGGNVVSMNDDNCAPLKITGAPLRGITYRTPVASAQIKSAILCAGLYAEGETTVIEPAPSRDHTERMLSAFGASIVKDGNKRVTIRPAQQLHPVDIMVPGDISSAAYFIAAALLKPGSELVIRNVGINSTRDGILKVAEAMGADIKKENIRGQESEPYCDLIVKSSALHGTTVEGDIIPTLIDELPVVALMGAIADGTTIIRDAAELKVKESDRIAAVTEGLAAMGADITTTNDGFVIRGGKPLHGANIRTFKDHRIAMAFAVASLIAEGDTVLDDETCVKISYPDFFRDLAGVTEE